MHIYICEKLVSKTQYLNLALQGHFLEWRLTRFGKELFIIETNLTTSTSLIPAFSSFRNLKSCIHKLFKRKQLSRFDSSYPPYTLMHLLSMCCHIEGITESIEKNPLLHKHMVSQFWHLNLYSMIGLKISQKVVISHQSYFKLLSALFIYLSQNMSETQVHQIV